ncbi:MAG: hypothetical protein CSA23_07020 [Deltaproteobacteria bacterium]|nr:MAG: hypothetical protein CSA23_07020 [Deltaproteobacteria bacterium]
MQLIIISPPDDFPDEHQVVRRILQRTSADFHLRKPEYSREALAAYLHRIPVDLHLRIMVHGHPDLLDRCDIGGIHFTERQRIADPLAVQRLRQKHPNCRISSAFHCIADISSSGDLLDYAFLSPIYDSISKPGYRTTFDRRELAAFLARTDRRVVALGGIDGRRIAEAGALGFWGVAVLGGVWADTVPEQSAQELAARCDGTNR